LEIAALDMDFAAVPVITVVPSVNHPLGLALLLRKLLPSCHLSTLSSYSLPLLSINLCSLVLVHRQPLESAQTAPAAVGLHARAPPLETAALNTGSVGAQRHIAVPVVIQILGLALNYYPIHFIYQLNVHFC
jgi:hypothetical protein